jgi:sarcosine oxidase
MRAPLAADHRGGVFWGQQLAAEGWPPPVPRQPPLPEEADAVVVGGGYCGMAAAAELAARGRSVVVLDAAWPGAMASGRNGGMVLPELTWGPRTLEARYGEVGLRMFAAVDEAFDLVESLVAEGIECEYERSGQLYLAHSSRAVAGLRTLAEEHRSVGHDAEVVEGDDLAAELGSTRFPAGLVLPRSGGLHPARFHRGLQLRAERAGALVRGRTTAVALEPRRGGGTVVRLDGGGRVVAGDVLLATNAYADGIAPSLRRRVLPVGSYIIATEPLDPDLAASVIPRRRMCFDTKNLLWYWRLGPEGRLLFGGRKGLGREDVDAARDHLYASMIEVHPQLAGVGVSRWWGGSVALTRDRLPHCGRIEGAWYATGCNGSGVALNTWMGKAMAGAMCGDPLPPFAELPHPVVPLHRWRRAYLPAVGAWYRLRDRIG